jgi:hypothetical protein
VYRQAVELTAFTTIVAVLIASSLLGVVGAILAVPFAAVIKIMLGEAGTPRRERMATPCATSVPPSRRRHPPPGELRGRVFDHRASTSAAYPRSTRRSAPWTRAAQPLFRR